VLAAVSLFGIAASQAAICTSCGGSSSGGSTPPVPTTYSGDAEVLYVNVTLLNGFSIPVNEVTAGPIPVTGGYASNTLATIPAVPLNLVSGYAATAVAEAGPNAQAPAGVNASYSFASVDGTAVSLNAVLPGALNISAQVISATANATCDANGNADLSGSSVLTALVINGNTINVTGQPNQTISIPQVAKITLNEQIVAVTSSTADGSMTVNAIDIVLVPPGSLLGPVITGQIIVSHAHADIECGTGS